MTEWCCKPDCPGRHPACRDQCEKYREWKGRLKTEKEYTENAIYRDKVNRGDYEKEGWMAHKGQRSRRRKWTGKALRQLRRRALATGRA